MEHDDVGEHCRTKSGLLAFQFAAMPSMQSSAGRKIFAYAALPPGPQRERHI
jgi:hypothetical protein